MEERDSFADHFDFLLIVVYIAIMAGVIFLMPASAGFHVGLLVVAAAIVIFMFYPRHSDDKPCGAAIGLDGITRPRPGASSHR